MSGDELYSQLKPAWHPQTLNEIMNVRQGLGGRPVPVHVQLILSDLCNQDCGFCAYRMSSGLSNQLFGTAETHNPNRKIPTDKALEIVEDCAAMGVKAIQFTGGGEPTVHPKHLEIMGLAQQLGMETALVTNGVRMDPTAPAIRKHKWIRVSVDAGDADTYSKVRRSPKWHWDKAWANIKSIAKDYDGVLGIGFVVTPENFEGIFAAAELAKDSGVDYMRVGAVFSAEGTRYYGDALITEIRHVVDRAKSTLDGDGFEVVDLFGRRVGDLDAASPTDPFCGYQYFTVYIGGDLNVYRCCNTAYTLEGKVGSLKDQRFLHAKLAYEPFDATGCRFCQFQGQNKAISALTQVPTHVNFV